MPGALKPWWTSDCGQFVIYQGCCLSVMPQLVRGSVDLIWTDPPYGHGNMDGDLQSTRVRDGVAGARVAEVEPIANDGREDMRRVVSGCLSEAKRVLAPDCCCCCCGGGGPVPTFAWVANELDSSLEFFHAVVWDKSARGNGLGWRYRRNYEFVMVAHQKGGKLLWADDDASVPNIVRHAPVHDRTHPNEKPVDMVADFVAWHSLHGSVVLDPFMGSGSTVVACVRTGRRFIGIELEERWCEVAVGRIQRELMERGSIKLPGPPNTRRGL